MQVVDFHKKKERKKNELKLKVKNKDLCSVFSAVTGFASCMTTGLTSMCGTEFSGLLDTVYDDVIDGVIGKAFTCEVSNTLLGTCKNGHMSNDE